MVVIGAGAIGLAIAWRAAQAGLSVTVVDGAPGRGASWAAAGMLAPVTEAHYGEDRLLRLNLAGQRRWPSFARELAEASGRETGYRETGTLVVARHADDNAVLGDLFAYQQALGLAVERLRGRECRALEPALSPRVRGGVLVRGDHQVDNRAFVVALQAAAERAGVTLCRAQATAVETAGDRVRGVRTEQDTVLPAGTVVLAAGHASTRIAGVPTAALPPVRPVKGQLLHLRALSGAAVLERTVRGLDVYLVPRGDGRLVVGATVEERGEDLTVTAGAVLELLRAAEELLPGVAEYGLVETVAGLRPGSPDNAPLIGPTALDGLVLASGHYRNGILLAPITADGVTALLTRGELPEELAGFSPQRFALEGAA